VYDAGGVWPVRRDGPGHRPVAAAGGHRHHPSSPVHAFKRAPSLEFSQGYMGSLTTNLAQQNETNGACCFVEAT